MALLPLYHHNWVIGPFSSFCAEVSTTSEIGYAVRIAVPAKCHWEKSLSSNSYGVLGGSWDLVSTHTLIDIPAYSWGSLYGAGYGDHN